MISQTSIDFLNELKINNNRDWFQAQKKRYDAYKKEYLQVADSLLSKHKTIDSNLSELTPKDCIFRINRDIRFSADKTPYKTHISFGFAPGGKKMLSASYYLHINNYDGSGFVGGGIYMPPADLLKRIRKEIDVYPDEFLEIVNNKNFTRFYPSSLDRTDGTVLSRPPKGFSAEHKAIEYLKLKSFTAVKNFDTTEATNPQFTEFVLDAFKSIQPLLHFMNEGIKAQMEEEDN